MAWCHDGVVLDTTTETPTERRITLRVPVILAGRVDKAVLERRGEERKFSLNDWIVEAIREKVDGPPAMPNPACYSSPHPDDVILFTTPKPPEIQPGRVGDGFWDNWMRESKRLEPDARQESFSEALRDRVAAGLQLPPKWGKMSPEARMAFLRMNDND